MSDPAIRIVVADDHPIVLHGLERLFERQGGFKVVKCCRNGSEALGVLRERPVDVLLLDLRMPGPGAVQTMRAAIDLQPTCRIVILTAQISPTDVARLIDAGAMGLVLKESSPEAVVDCIRRVHAGDQWIDQGSLTPITERHAGVGMPRPHPDVPLTPRELEIVQMVSEGLRNREIATRLTISEGTVKIHLHNVYEKIGVDGRMELLLYAQDRGIV